MKHHQVRSGFIGVATCVSLLAALPAQASAGDDVDFAELLAEKSPAIVTIKFVLKMKTRSGDSESEREAAGVVIEPDGLILCANSRLGDSRARRSGSAATPTDIKVLIGDDTEGLDAEVIARDSELDLTWLRITEPGDREFSFITLKESAVAEIGQRIYSVARLGKHFDRVAVVRQARIGGITTKPRRLLIPTGGSGSLGLPVYNAKGEVVGVTVTQMPDPVEMQGMSASAGAAALILPGNEVARATRRALEAAADEEEEDEGD